MANDSVIISGASTGIGYCCAEALSRLGYTVFAGVRRKEDAARLQAGLPGLVPVLLDITDEASVLNAVETVRRHPQGDALSGLVNNAGVVVGGPLECIPPKLLRYQFEVNITGQMAVTQAFLSMLRKNRGRIVNIGSVSGLSAIPFMGPYSASKFAIEALTDALRMELKPWGMHVAVIEPGSVATPLWEKSFALAEEIAREAAADYEALYGDAMAKAKEYARKSAQRGIHPDRVASAVVHSLTADKPKTRYLVGPDAWRYRFLRYLPDRLTDRLITWRLGLWP